MKLARKMFGFPEIAVAALSRDRAGNREPYSI